MNLAEHKASRAERELLETLRNQYEAQGFSFRIAPARQQVPDFLLPYMPDAIATKPGENVAIEVKRRITRQSEHTLQQIRARFEGQPGWTFVVAYVADDLLDSLTIPPAAVPTIRRQLADVRNLARQGQTRAAFLLAWSLVEATLLTIEQDSEARPRTPASVLQALAMLGRLEPISEQRLRPMIRLRNAIVHGDLAAEPTQQDVETVALAVEEALSEA